MLGKSSGGKEKGKTQGKEAFDHGQVYFSVQTEQVNAGKARFAHPTAAINDLLLLKYAFYFSVTPPLAAAKTRPSLLSD